MSSSVPTAAALRGLALGLVLGLGVAAGTARAQGESHEPILPLPLELKLDPRKVALGERLFNDKRLSRDDTLSCASCHALTRGGSDARVTSIGIGGAVGPINAPTVFNTAFNFRQFWDGRAASLEEQVAAPIHNPKELGSSWEQVVAKLSRDETLRREFRSVYGDGIAQRNIADAIATYERSLVTPNARFDRFLRGDRNAITATELRGYRLFKDYGCVACHQGVNVGGNMFQVFGVMGNYFKERGHVTESDYGRYNVTRAEQDRFVFKVPSLRNVALTAPYFHDGSARTLEDAVDVMFRHQLGRRAPARDKQDIVSFLHTLTGEYLGRPLDARAPAALARAAGD